ncbi:MAG: InlB B-repeat-containing protein [Candidatus Coproplasma sp.]
MNKRKFSLLFVFLIALSCSLSALFGCGSSCEHTDKVLIEDIAATCTEAGSQKFHCNNCKQDIIVRIPATGHTEVILPGVAATCTEPGLTDGKICSGCQKVIIAQTTIPAKGHHDDNGVITTLPTCTEAGVKTYTCVDCGLTRTETIPATGHHYNDGVVTTEPTCTEAGVKTYTCVDCGLTRTETIPATGHHYNDGVVTTEPTCTEAGVKTYTCADCGDTKTEPVPATGHHYDDGVVTTEPTCTEAGVKTYTCSVCSHTKTEPVPATGHTESAEGVITTQPTCTEPGVKTYYCSECHEALRTESVPANGHSYDEGVITTQPTCTEAGVKTYTCSVCGHTKTEPVPATGHSYDEGVITTQPTCTEAGVKTYTCTHGDCGDYYTEPVPATGHSYDEGVITTQPTCTEAGVKTYTCSVCSHTKTEPVPATGHTEVPIGEAEESTCTKAGHTAGIKCETCGEIIEAQQTLPLKAHDYVDGVCSSCGDEEVYTIKFYVDGVLFDEQTYTASNKNIVEPTIPAKDGYTIVGWQNYILKGNVEVNAVYTANTYTITLNAGNGTLTGSKEYKVTFHTSYTLPIPTYEGYVFVGWFSSTSSTATQYTDDEGQCLIPYDYAGNKNYYAQWSAPKVDITIDFDNGQPTKAIALPYGSAFNLDGIVDQPTKTGYIFDGWYTEGGEEYTFSTLIRQTVTLKAKWTQSTAISTAAELFAIADDPTLNYHLTKDITLPNSNKVWTTIDTFSGILNGNGYSIINISFTLGDNASYGFVKTNDGTIENLNFSRVTYTQKITSGGDYRSGIIAGNNNGTIKNCHLLDGTISYTIDVWNISTSYYLGTLVGYNSGTIYDCSTKIDTTVNITAQANSGNFDIYYFIGGLVGENNGTLESVWSDNTLIVNNTAYGYYTNYRDRWMTNHIRLGGLVGDNTKTITKCYSVTDISLSQNKNGRGTVNTYFGGFVAYNRSGATAQNSFANGAITLSGSADTQYCGGFVGLNNSTSNIYNCYSTVDVNANSGGNIGGFIGQNDGANIAGCYSSGNITATAGGTMGGFIGNCTNAGGSISNCYSCGDVTTNGGTAGLFVGSSAAAISDCYFMKDARLTYNGVPVDVSSELDGTIDGKFCYDIWSEAFLTEELFWTSEDGWIILTDEDPIFDWEIAVFHDYDTYVFEPTCDYYGYTLYLCNDCTRFFVRDIVEPLGHDFPSTPVIKEATCTESGYKYYACQREGCTEEHGKIYIAETYEPLGHTAGEVVYGTASDGKDKTYAATCTEEGRTTYICSVCNKEFTVITPALGHDEYVSIAEVNASCYYNAETSEYITIGGHTAEISCHTCGEVIKASEVIEPHHHFTYNYTVDPTCTQVGSGTATCEMCGYVLVSEEFPMLDHVDVNGDYRCDVCHTFLNSDDDELTEEEYVKISTPEGLKAIADDLMGTYVLTANITITGDWTPIGTEEAPFRGRLFGNGYTISGLTSTNAEVGGLFGYNYGFISGITLDGFTMTVNNSDCVFGGIAAYNRGKIMACVVSGTVNITVTCELETNEVSTKASVITNTIGGIVGVNDRGGIIASCSSSAEYNNTYNNTARTTFKTDYNWFWQAANKLFNSDKVQYKNYVTRSIDTIYFGQICGYNSATIDSCSAGSKGTNTINVKAETTQKTGTAIARTVYCQVDAICGHNSGEYLGTMLPGPLFNYALTCNYQDNVDEFYYKMQSEIEYNVGTNS